MKLKQAGSEELPGGTKGAHGCLGKGMVWVSECCLLLKIRVMQN